MTQLRQLRNRHNWSLGVKTQQYRRKEVAMKSEWLTAREAAGIVRVHPVTLLKWAREGKVPHRRLSARKIVFPLSQLTAWMEAQSYTDPVGHAAQPERTAV